jgi:micrococcal nuclease
MYEYRAKILSVVDGDTVDVDLDLGFKTILHKERVRIAGIDTPESRTTDKVEKKFGLASKERLKELLGKEAIVKTMKPDSKEKFGRILGDFILADGRMVSQVMIEEGHAVPYTGDNKENVKELHLKNRERLLAEGKVKL